METFRIHALLTTLFEHLQLPLALRRQFHNSHGIKSAPIFQCNAEAYLTQPTLS